MEMGNIFLYGYSILIGVCLGSFLNVVIYRLPENEQFMKGRSYCRNCDHQLVWYDLIPIISWIQLRGRCRYCANRVSLRYPIIECLGGVFALWSLLQFNPSWKGLLMYSILMILLVISMIDIDHMLILNRMLIALLIPILIWMYVYSEISMKERILGFFIMSIPMYILIVWIPNCFGGGDVKLIAVCGLLLGWKQTIVAMLIAIFMGGFHASFILLRKRAYYNKHIAFGPYICIGVVSAMLYGEVMISRYLSLFDFM